MSWTTAPDVTKRFGRAVVLVRSRAFLNDYCKFTSR
jgi:hypothetical protein